MPVDRWLVHAIPLPVCDGSFDSRDVRRYCRDVLLVSALIAIVVVLAFTGWGVLAYVLTGLVFAALFLASFVANRRANHR